MSRRHLKKYYIEWSVRPKRIGWGVISDFNKLLDCVDKGYGVARKAVTNPLAGKKDSKGLYDRKNKEFYPIDRSKIFIVDDVENNFSTICVYELDGDGCYDENAPIAEINPMEMRVWEGSDQWWKPRFLKSMGDYMQFVKRASLPFGACSQKGEEWITAGFTLQLGGGQEFYADSLELVIPDFNSQVALGIYRCVQAFQLAYKGNVLDADEVPRSISGSLHAFVGVVHPDGESTLSSFNYINEKTGEIGCETYYKDPPPIISMSTEDLEFCDFDELARLTCYHYDEEVRRWTFNYEDPDPETVETVKASANAMDEDMLVGVAGDEEDLDDSESDEDETAEDEEDDSESDDDEDCEEDEEREGEDDGLAADDEREEISDKRLWVFRIIGMLFGWAGLHFLYAKKKKSMYLSLALLLWAVVEYFLARPIDFKTAPFSALRFQFAIIFVGLLWFLSARYCEKDGNGRTMT